MNLSEIETFLMIVKTKNITKTADNLFLSQPTVSHRLKLLEDELGVKLIVRKKGFKQIELTTQGEEFIPIAERWVSVWKEMQFLKEGQEKLQLKVGCTDTLNSAIFFDLYKDMLGEEKHIVNLQVKTHYSHEIYGLLEKNDIDIGFVHHYLHYKNVIAEPILKEKMYIVQSDDPQVNKPLIHTDELKPDSEIFLSWEVNYEIWHNQWVDKDRQPRIQVDTFELLFHLLSTKRMWAIVPVSVAERINHLRPIMISEIANHQLPPERITYKIRHKYPNEAKLKAVRVFEKRIDMYLRQKNWGYTGRCAHE